jgi:undecaprenyl-diphosphatase
MDFLLNIDTNLFYFINVDLANSLFEDFFPFITDIKNWYLLILCGLLWCIVKDGTRGRLFVPAIILAILISDQVSSELIKEAVARPRPCHTLDDINLLVNCGRGYSFTSSHAANSFMAATFISSFYKKYAWAMYTMAGLIAFSRVVVGVHYPLDIVCGTIVGLTLGFAWSYTCRWIISKTKFYNEVYNK